MRKKGKKLSFMTDDDVSDDPPELFPDLLPVFESWGELCSSRQSGMSLTGLSWSEVSQWCEDHGMTGRWRLRWIRLVRALDMVFVAHSLKKTTNARTPNHTEQRRVRESSRKV